ncbi:hypothetical protein ACH5RR_039212 [Cinchona calisaya]|uniref:Uncharacterized protein n=1 Tax=Cinchona calisaya TaxID=153742 RepID=A0ABD2Y331_9GENT
MADQEQEKDHHQQQEQQESFEKLLTSYLGLSFTTFLVFVPKNFFSLLSSLKSQNKDLSFKLMKAEEQLKQLHSRRKEDSKANARVVEIFASHRHAWQQEEKRLLQQIDESAETIAHLRGKVEDFEKLEAELRSNIEELKRDVNERDEMLNFMSMTSYGGGAACDSGGGEFYSEMGLRYGEKCGGVSERVEECYLGSGVHNMEEMESLYGKNNGFNTEFLSSASKFWAERGRLWQQGVQCESLEPLYNLKHFVARRESPWKVDGESTGVSSKLKLLEQELLNLEKIGKTDLSKMPSILRKQAKRYQTLAGKIDDLCRRMQASDPCEPTLSSEFLLEAFRLQQRASETSQKLIALQTEAGKSYLGNELEGQAILGTKRSMDSIKNNFKEIQRNLEIWLARIIGDLEGILARDGANRVREYYISRYPFAQ